MELTSEQRQPFIRQATDLRHNAPRAVIQALVSLTLVDDVIASLAMRRELDGVTTWRTLWLTARSLIFVEATKEGDWTLESVDQEPGGISGWTRPLTEIRSIRIADMSKIGRSVNNAWTWTLGTEVLFADGTAVRLPLFGGVPEHPIAGQVESFAEALQRSWPARSA